MDAIASGEPASTAALLEAVRALPTPLAVRSSAVGEDSAGASFAGQHITVLNVPSADDVEAAVREVWWSANSDSAITYRKRLGVFARPSVGVVVQSLLQPDTAGVMFTRNPITGADERMIEASWGLGEAVVSGRVIPDSFRVARGARCSRRAPALKKFAIRSGRGRRHRRRGRRARAGRVAVPERRAARRRCPTWPPTASGSTARSVTSSGPSPTDSSTCCSAAR